MNPQMIPKLVKVPEKSPAKRVPDGRLEDVQIVDIGASMKPAEIVPYQEHGINKEETKKKPTEIALRQADLVFRIHPFVILYHTSGS